MTKRLLLSYLGLALLTLVVLELPLAVLAQRHQHEVATSQADRAAAGLAAVAAEDLQTGSVPALATTIRNYAARTGWQVAVIDASGRPLAVSTTGDETFLARGQYQLRSALAGRPASEFTLHGGPWLTAAAPFMTGVRKRGAVLIGASGERTEARVHAFWLELTGFAAAVLVLTALVGMLVARSVARPLAKLQSAVSRFGVGELGVRAADSGGPPEVRSLARQFNQMAQRITDLVDAQRRFVADASHQLRSPLTALRLRLENLEAAEAGEAEGLAAAAREVQRLSRIVDGLLALSRAGSDLPERCPVRVDQAIEERCDAWSAQASERRIRLERAADGLAGTRAMLVPGDLDQILDNLLANALDASPEGSRISVKLGRAGPDAVDLHVVDEGPGMTADERERAFDRFWRGSHTNGHSGLGLAIVRQLAARNDASVELLEAPPGGVDAVVHLRTIIGSS